MEVGGGGAEGGIIKGVVDEVSVELAIVVLFASVELVRVMCGG